MTYLQAARGVCIIATAKVNSDEDLRKQMKMATQREKDAAEYLQKHRIMELLENLNSLMFFYRPGSDPHLNTETTMLITYKLDRMTNAMLIPKIKLVMKCTLLVRHNF